jgi:hypothetical protein
MLHGVVTRFSVDLQPFQAGGKDEQHKLSLDIVAKRYLSPWFCVLGLCFAKLT